MKPIKVAVIGVGNCASSLVQGVAHYRSNNSSQGLIHDRIGGYGAGDVDFVLGVDVDARKVGKDIAEAIFAAPNNTAVFHADVPATGAKVIMGRVSDGVAPHMTGMGERGFLVADAPGRERVLAHGVADVPQGGHVAAERGADVESECVHVQEAARRRALQGVCGLNPPAPSAARPIRAGR